MGTLTSAFIPLKSGQHPRQGRRATCHEQVTDREDQGFHCRGTPLPKILLRTREDELGT